MTNDEVAAVWRQTPVSTLTWEPCAEQPVTRPSESGVCLASARGLPRRAYAKPIAAPDENPERARAAREKIASDLAFDLGLSVPPAQLATMTIADRVRPVVLSLEMYPESWIWPEVAAQSTGPSVYGAALGKVLADCSPMLAFYTWLGQGDSGDTANNILWGYHRSNTSTSKLIFFDFANSLGFDGSWLNGGWANVGVAPLPSLMMQLLDRRLLRTTISAIATFPERAISEIVNRIPSDFLSATQKTILCEGLTGRRSRIGDCLSDFTHI